MLRGDPAAPPRCDPGVALMYANVGALARKIIITVFISSISQDGIVVKEYTASALHAAVALLSIFNP